MFTSAISTPLGTIVIMADHKAVNFIGFPELLPEENPNHLTQTAAGQLNEYLHGQRQRFDFPIRQQGTDFQQRVWTELLQIEAGSPISYAAFSKNLNHPLAIRAIAAANGKNKLMIVVPCHRIIGSDGKLVGYAGGLWRKKWLLQHEAAMTGIGQVSMTL